MLAVLLAISFPVLAGCGGAPVDGVAAAPSPLPVAASSAVPPSVASSAPPSSSSSARPAPSSAPVPPSATPVRGCRSPEFTTSDPDGGWSDGGYYVHNNMWNAGEAGPETLRACAYDNWYVDSTQPDSTSVKTYPNVHKDINNQNGKPFNDYSVIKSTFAGRGPGTGVYDVAYDLWLNGVGNGKGVTEVMVWTENSKQVPSGDKLTTYTAGGLTYDVWADDEGYVAFVSRATQYSGSVDLKAMIAWAIGKGLVPANPTVNQIGYGIEFCSTGGGKARFTLSDFSVTMS
ncbi:GH12 family glycosyl hydrolase domain-containing protein [Amycolatopsis sp. lyj-23]|uniref:GH12 family glycosyl hydrolase domain-containing protein n=1 Tax=Amycolatopsis sp. lyj-23 TaxID=2789283 RepID=UPI00397E38AF